MEFALVKARSVRIDNLAGEGGFSAKLTQKILGNLEAYLAACQLGITMASLGLGWVGEPAVAALLSPLLLPLGLGEEGLHTVSFLLGFVIFSSLHIVVGEQVPKTLAIRRPEPMALVCAAPLRLFFLIFYPLNWLLNSTSRGMLRLLGVEEAPHVDVLTGPELQGLVSNSVEHGTLSQGKAEMLHNVFRFDERSIGRVMIPRVECHVLDTDDDPETIIATMKETKHSRFPVIRGDQDNLVGIVLAKDLMDAMLDGVEAPWTRLSEYSRDPHVVPESLKISTLFDAMRAEKIHMACVIDEYGSFVGLVTMEDLLEEIVGEIIDETDDSPTEFPIEVTDAGWTAHGLASLSDVERVTGLVVPDDLEANTLSGLLMQRLERMPDVSDRIEEAGFSLTVTAVKDRRVETVTIEKLTEPVEVAKEE